MNSFIKTIKKEEKNFYEKGVKVSYEKLKNLVKYLNEKFDTNKEINNKINTMSKDIGTIKSQLDSVANDLKDAKKIIKGAAQIKVIEAAAAKNGLNGSVFDFFKKNNFVADSDKNTFNLEGEGESSEIIIDVPKYEDKELKFTFKSNDKASSGIKDITLADKSSSEKTSTSDDKLGKAKNASNNIKSGNLTKDNTIIDKIALYNIIKDRCLGVTRSNLETIINTMNNKFYNEKQITSINNKLLKLKNDYEKGHLVVNKNAVKVDVIAEEIYNHTGETNEQGKDWEEYVKQADNVKIKGNESSKSLASKNEKSKEKKENEVQNIKNYIKSFLEELSSMSENGIDFDYKSDIDEIKGKFEDSNNSELQVKPKDNDSEGGFEYETEGETTETSSSDNNNKKSQSKITKLKIKKISENIGFSLEKKNSDGATEKINEILTESKKTKKTVSFKSLMEKYNLQIPNGFKEDISGLKIDIEVPEIFYYISSDFNNVVNEGAPTQEQLDQEKAEQDEARNEAVQEQAGNLEPSSDSAGD